MSNWNFLHHHTSIQHLPTDSLLPPVKKSFPRLAEQSTGYQDRPSRLAKSESTHEQHPLPEPSLPSSSSLSLPSSPSQPVLILAVATTLTSSSPSPRSHENLTPLSRNTERPSKHGSSTHQQILRLLPCRPLARRPNPCVAGRTSSIPVRTATTMLRGEHDAWIDGAQWHEEKSLEDFRGVQRGPGGIR